MLSRIVMVIELVAFVLPTMVPYTVFFIFMGLPSLVALPLSPIIMLHEGVDAYALFMIATTFSISVLYVFILVLVAKLSLPYVFGKKNTLRWWRRNTHVCMVANGILLTLASLLVLSSKMSWFREGVETSSRSGFAADMLSFFYFSGVSLLIPVLHVWLSSYRSGFLLKYTSEVPLENGQGKPR